MSEKIILSIGARSDLVKTVQKNLGLSPDGDFGPGTQSAIKIWQTAHNIKATGDVDESTWRGITKLDIPSLFERCLSLTMCFEGHNYTLAAGNWDGAGLTWGIIGFTIKSGSLYDVLNLIPQTDLDTVFGKREAQELILAAKTKSISWGDGISLAPSKVKLKSPWQEKFVVLGNHDTEQSYKKLLIDHVISGLYKVKNINIDGYNIFLSHYAWFRE